MDVFRDLGHKSAVSRLVKDDVDVVKRGADRFAIAQVAFNEFHLIRYPRRFSAAMRLRLKIIQDAYFPAFSHEQVGYMRTDQTSTACDERALHFSVHGTRFTASGFLIPLLSGQLRSARF